MNGTVYEKTLYQEPEGIDTISLMLYKAYVNTGLWTSSQRKSLSPYVSVTTKGSAFNLFYFFHIQAEYLNMKENILQQVLSAVYNELYGNGFLNSRIFDSEGQARNLIFDNPCSIFTLAELDFNFDFPKNNIPCINPDGKKDFKGTLYSKKPRDGDSKDIWYDRRKKLKQQNQIPYCKIDAMQRPQRFEIKLSKCNCHYMNLNNLNGDYDFIVRNIWRPHLARAVGKFFPESYICNEGLWISNPYFCELQSSFALNPHERNSENLMRTPIRGQF